MSPNHHDFWRNRVVVVTGAAGFIGSHVAETLARHGARVRAFVHYNALGTAGWLDTLDGPARGAIEVVAGELREFHGVRDALRGADTVFHLGALIAIPFSYRSPVSYVRTNVEGTWNVLEAARELGLRRVVCTSTSEVYGTAQRVPIDESHPLQAQSPYAASKIGADALAESCWRSFGVPVTIARPFNTFGPRQSARAIIPTILLQLFKGAHELRLGSLAPTRDLNFVQDTADGMIALGAAPDSVLGRVYNFGSGREIGVGQLADLIMTIVGKRIPITSDTERVRPGASEVERLLCESTRARAELSWQPRTGLDDGLRLTAEWVERNLASYGAESYRL